LSIIKILKLCITHQTESKKNRISVQAMTALYVKAAEKSILVYVAVQRLLMAYAKTLTAYNIVKLRMKNVMTAMGKERYIYENTLR